MHPPACADSVAKVRIFTPGRGHLRTQRCALPGYWPIMDRLPTGQRHVSLEEGIGLVPVRMRLHLKDGRAANIEIGGGVMPVFESVLRLPS